MKIFDLEYKFYKSVRLVRSSYLRRKLIKRFSTKEQLIRAAAVLAFSFVILFSDTSWRNASAEDTYLDPDSAEINTSEIISTNSGVLAASNTSSNNSTEDVPELRFLTSKSVYLIDRDTGKVLYEKNSEERIAPASITKIMTAMVAMQNYEFGEAVVVPQRCTQLAGNTVGLKSGETWTVEELMYGLLLASASDAACALASHQTTYADFTTAMNLQAKAMGLKDSHFANPIGLDENGHYSTAKDLVAMGMFMMQNDKFREIVATENIEFYGRRLESTNELLGVVDGLTGIKTGFTENAGECLLFSVERGGKNIIGVVLGSEDRFGEAEQLIKWAYK